MFIKGTAQLFDLFWVQLLSFRVKHPMLNDHSVLHILTPVQHLGASVTA